jgi:cyanophycin synthetase
MFDHIIIRQEKHLRGRTEAEINNYYLKGYQLDPLLTKSFPKKLKQLNMQSIAREEGSFITALSDVVTNAIEIVQEYLDKEREW